MGLTPKLVDKNEQILSRKFDQYLNVLFANFHHVQFANHNNLIRKLKFENKLQQIRRQNIFGNLIF
jgi:hypothetical protein